jgi:hypothetical protein
MLFCIIFIFFFFFYKVYYKPLDLKSRVNNNEEFFPSNGNIIIYLALRPIVLKIEYNVVSIYIID